MSMTERHWKSIRQSRVRVHLKQRKSELNSYLCTVRINNNNLVPEISSSEIIYNNQKQGVLLNVKTHQLGWLKPSNLRLPKLIKATTYNNYKSLTKSFLQTAYCNNHLPLLIEKNKYSLSGPLPKSSTPNREKKTIQS